MIERFFLKSYLSFQTATLELEPGLIVFSGPSGSGKSILIQAILSSFGMANSEASVAESSVTWKIDESFGIENEDINIFKQLKKEKTRYFLNAQSISKKNISAVASPHLRHLSLKDYSDFENKNLLELLDSFIAKQDISIIEEKNNFHELYKAFNRCSKALQKIQEDEKVVEEKKEFLSFEINKITSINPKEGEYEELLEIKKQLSKKEKVQEAITKAYTVFDMEHYVYDVFELLEEDSGFFDDCMNQLRAKLESANEHFVALEEIDVEEVLDRLEALHELIRKYGSIEEALKHLAIKKEELEKYNNIAFEKEHLTKEYEKLFKALNKAANELSTKRRTFLKELEKKVDHYIKQLYLDGISFDIEQTDSINYDGQDKITLRLKNGVSLEQMSTGEFNRVRLAILAVGSEVFQNEKGVLILDEIDANLSGEESMSVAKVLKQLSKKYQILVISHQPQLTSQGMQHFFVYKDKNGVSNVKELSYEERVEEIARIISGENVTKEAKEFAKELLKNNKN